MSVKVNASNNEWVIGNLKHSGYYRVNYDNQNWNLMIKQLNTDFTQIDDINRAALIDDAYNLGKGEVINQTVFLDIIRHLENDTNHITWRVTLEAMNYISNQMVSCNSWTYNSYKVYRNIQNI